MQKVSAYCLIIILTLIIDVCVRWAISRSKESMAIKPIGLLALLLLCFLQGSRHYAQRSKVIKQYFLSLLIVLFSLTANWLILDFGLPHHADVLGFGLLVTPIFTLPFFHFLYGLIGIDPLFADDLLLDFRTRGAIAIILGANVIFIALEPVQHIIGIFIYFSLAFSALVGLFFLCAEQRKIASVYRAPFQQRDLGLEPMMLYYLASILEVLYYFILIAKVFLATTLESWLQSALNFWSFSFIVGLLILFTTLFVKIKTVLGSAISIEFYEEKALPISFIFFGFISMVRFYF